MRSRQDDNEDYYRDDKRRSYRQNDEPKRNRSDRRTRLNTQDDNQGTDNRQALSRRKTSPDNSYSKQGDPRQLCRKRERPSSRSQERTQSSRGKDRRDDRRDESRGNNKRSGAGKTGRDRQNNEDNNSKDQGYASDNSVVSDIGAKKKQMKGKEILIGGLATVATIHAASNIFSSFEAHEKRKEQVADGDMTAGEAKKKRHKAWVQDAAAVGIAALSIRGAISEWKEVKEHRNNMSEIERRHRKAQKKINREREQQEKDQQERMLMMMAGSNGSQ